MANPKNFLLKARKECIRKELRKRRGFLTQQRREEASREAFLSLSERLASFDLILSYSSFESELDLSLLNLDLARTGRLLLPKMHGKELKIFHVTDPETQLLRNSLGINEPCPVLCQEVSFDRISCILVPGLGFDLEQHRIGHGKGYYDRLFQKLSIPLRFGVGFREQLVKKLPITTTDISLSSLYLF